MSLRVAFCVSGRGRLARAAIDAAPALGIVPATVVLDGTADPALAEFARERGVPAVCLEGADGARFDADRARFDADLVAACERARADLVLLTFNKLVPAALVRSLPGRIVNVHMSLLPAFPGFGALRQAAGCGVKFAGATLHLVGEGVDDGPIIGQCLVPVAPGADAADLGAALFPRLLGLTLQTLAWFAAGRVWRDAAGRVWVRDASYVDGMVCPAVEPAVAEVVGARSPASAAPAPRCTP